MADLVYDFAFQSLLRGMSAAQAEALTPGWMALGIDPDRLEPSYSRAVWEAAVEAAARQMPGETREDQHRGLGALVIEGFARTRFGRVVSAATRLLGPRRVLQQAPRNFSFTNTFVRAQVLTLEENAASIRVTPPSPSVPFLVGTVESMTRYAGATRVSSTWNLGDDGTLIVFVTWA